MKLRCQNVKLLLTEPLSTLEHDFNTLILNRLDQYSRSSGVAALQRSPTQVTLEELFAPFRPPLTNLVDHLQYWTEEQPTAIAFYFLRDGLDTEIQLTYGELDRRARAIGAELASRGLAGEPVLLLYPPGVDFLYGLLGCLYAGAIAVPAYLPRRNRNTERVQSISQDCEARFALTVREAIDRLQDGLSATPELNQLTWLATDELSLCQPVVDSQPPRARDQTSALIQYTSGSTGNPKGVVLTHANLMHNCGLITEAFEFSRSGSGMTWLPLYHDMGLLGGVLAPLYLGRPNVIMSPLAFLQRPIRWLQAITDYQVTVSGGPNFAYALCNEKITPEQCRGLDLSSWEVAFNGGEVIRSDTLDDFTRRFAPYGFRAEAHYPCYGLAETTLIVSGAGKRDRPIIRAFDVKELEQRRVVPLEKGAEYSRQLVGCGTVLPGGELRIVDPDSNRPVEEARLGEIWVSGASVAQGYWKKSEATEQIFGARLPDEDNRRFLRTGDLGFVLDGELFITGRLKDLIIIRGVNRYPEDIEETVESSADQLRTQASAAFAVDVDGSEKLVVVAEVNRGLHQEWGGVVEAARRNVAIQHEVQLDAVVLVRSGSIPKTSSAKIQRHSCRSGFLENKLAVIHRWQAWSENPEEDLAATSNPGL